MQFTKVSILINPRVRVPYFIGSQLRGAFGYALKKVTCINPSFQCKECFAANNCLYYSFYEQKNSFHKYRLDFELGHNYYDFSFYLFNDACKRLPYVVSALHMMLTQLGLGKERVTFTDFAMYINDISCMDNKEIKLPKNYINTLHIDDIYESISVELVTPLRIKKNNIFLRDDHLELKDLINSIYQRQMKLLNQGYKKFPYDIQGDIVTKDINYKELTRLSNRQKTTMNLGGIIGKIEVKNLNKESYEVLKVGELIGVGKQTVFGLGKIRVKEIYE